MDEALRRAERAAALDGEDARAKAERDAILARALTPRRIALRLRVAAAMHANVRQWLKGDPPLPCCERALAAPRGLFECMAAHTAHRLSIEHLEAVVSLDLPRWRRWYLSYKEDSDGRA